MTSMIAGGLQEICARERAVIELGPLAAPGRLARLAPFVAVIALTVPLVLFDEDGHSTVQVVTAALSVFTLSAAALVPWGRLPRRAQEVSLLLPMSLVASLVLMTGGLHSQFRPLLLLPLFWLMLYESRRSLWLALALTAGFIAVEALGSSSLETARRTIPVAVGLVLLPMIGRIVGVHRQAVVTLAELAERDSLTGVLNRRGLDRRVRSMQRAPFVGLGVLYLDVDGFKAVNDRWGHDAGDELLRQISLRLNAATRRDDVVSRVGGDEFVVVVAGDRAVAAGIRDRVRRSTNDEPYTLGGELVAASVSVGLSYTDSQAEQVESLITAADAGMLSAKGGNKRGIWPSG